MQYIYTKDVKIVNSPVNKTFDDLFNCSERKFGQWVDDLCEFVTKNWDEKGQPPKAGVRLEDVGAEFNRICQVDC